MQVLLFLCFHYIKGCTTNEGEWSTWWVRGEGSGSACPRECKLMINTRKKRKERRKITSTDRMQSFQMTLQDSTEPHLIFIKQRHSKIDLPPPKTCTFSKSFFFLLCAYIIKNLHYCWQRPESFTRRNWWQRKFGHPLNNCDSLRNKLQCWQI